MSEVKALRCAGIQRFVDTYLDGEFAESERAEFENHLSGCEPCRERIKVQAAWKVAIRGAAPRETAPAALRNRVQRAIAKESRSRQTKSWRSFVTRVLPVAAAAGLVGSLMVARLQLSPVAADVIAKHQRNLPIEISGAGGRDQVKQWYADKVGFPVKPPSLCNACALRGGRLAEVANQQAAYLVYDVNGNKVSVFIFDPASVPLELPQKATVTATGGTRDVYLDQEHGYNVAVFRDNGVGYAIAGDLDREQMLKMVSSTVSQP